MKKFCFRKVKKPYGFRQEVRPMPQIVNAGMTANVIMTEIVI